jgi:hypothetical protein
MVDSRDLLKSAIKLVLHAKTLEKMLRAYLYAMAKTNGLYVGVTEHISCKHSHRVGIVEEPSVRTNLFDVLCKALKNVDSSESTEDTADTEGITDGLTETVLLRDLKVDDGARIVKTYLNSVNYEICVTKSVLSLLYAKILLNGSSALVDGFVHLGNKEIGLLESVRVYIVERDLHIVKRVTKHCVAEYVLGKYGASRTHKCYLHIVLLVIFSAVISRRGAIDFIIPYTKNLSIRKNIFL